MDPRLKTLIQFQTKICDFPPDISELGPKHRIGTPFLVRYINIVTWHPGFRDKLLYLVLFSLCPSLFWELKDKRNENKTRPMPSQSEKHPISDQNAIICPFSDQMSSKPRLLGPHIPREYPPGSDGLLMDEKSIEAYRPPLVLASLPILKAEKKNLHQERSTPRELFLCLHCPIFQLAAHNRIPSISSLLRGSGRVFSRFGI